MDQKCCTTIMSADPRKSLRPRESHPGVIPDDPGLSRIKTWVMPSRPSPGGLPKRRCQTRDLSRTLRVGANLWLRVTYTAQEGHDLPFGEDRFVLAGIQHLALEQDSPTVLFARVGSLLKTFGLSEDGRTVSLLRQRFARLAGLSVRLLFGRSEDELEEHVNAEQIFIIRKYALPRY